MANPTALYSYQRQAPEPLPKKILLSDGRKRTDVSSYTDEEILDAGFTGPYEVPSFDQEYQRLLWDSETLSFVVEDLSDGELWQRIRDKRDRLLAKCDWIMTVDAPEDLNFHEWEMYRQRLRDIPSFYERPQDVQWPISPEGRSDEDFDQPRFYEDRMIWRIRDAEKIIKDLSYRVIKPFLSWRWDEVEEKWKAPVDMPDYNVETHVCYWDESNQEWIISPILGEV